MDTVGENFRGIHAKQLLDGSSGWTLEKLQAAAFDSYQPGFATLVPALLRAYDALPAADPRRAHLAQPIAVLRPWDYRWSSASVAQSLAIKWGDALIAILDPPADEDGNIYMARLARDTTDAQKLAALDDAMSELQQDFGRWDVPWGEINRFERISPSIKPQFSDEGPSIPVPFGSANYGSLASFVMRVPKTTRHLYGTYGNSFVAVVEFGGRVRAHAVTAGGESGDAKSPHFNDQAQRFASGDLRDGLFLSGSAEGPHRADLPARRISYSPANLSVARTRPSVTPGSLNKCPPSGTMLSSTSGHACLSCHAATGGVQLSCRPWTMTPGIPLQLRRLAQQLAFLDPAVRRHVVVLDPGDRDRDIGRGEMLDRLRAREQGDDVAFPFAPRLGGGELLVLVVAGQALAIGFDEVAALAFGDRRQELLELVGIDLGSAAFACTSSRSQTGRTGRCREAPARSRAPDISRHKRARGSSPSCRRTPATCRPWRPRCAASRYRRPGARSCWPRGWRKASTCRSRAGRTPGSCTCPD